MRRQPGIGQRGEGDQFPSPSPQKPQVFFIIKAKGVVLGDAHALADVVARRGGNSVFVGPTLHRRGRGRENGRACRRGPGHIAC